MANLVVTGTRHGRADVEDTLKVYVRFFGRPEFLILGDDEGVDRQAFLWALGRMPLNRVVICRANWSRGLKAGPERNARMIKEASRGDHLLAFPADDSRGTWDCLRQGLAAGLLCVVVKPGWLEELSQLERCK